jgi:hypothetical protein
VVEEPAYRDQYPCNGCDKSFTNREVPIDGIRQQAYQRQRKVGNEQKHHDGRQSQSSMEKDHLVGMRRSLNAEIRTMNAVGIAA